jgi:hypothetical protein
VSIFVAKTVTGLIPSSPRRARLKGWQQPGLWPWFETRRFATLLTMRKAQIESQDEKTKNLRREGQMGPCLTDAARGAAPDEAIRARAATPMPE